MGEVIYGFMGACVAYIARPTELFESRVSDSVRRVDSTVVGDMAPAYFESLDDAALTCGKAFPASSKRLVLTLMLAGCEFGMFVQRCGGLLARRRVRRWSWGRRCSRIGARIRRS